MKFFTTNVNWWLTLVPEQLYSNAIGLSLQKTNKKARKEGLFYTFMNTLCILHILTYKHILFASILHVRYEIFFLEEKNHRFYQTLFYLAPFFFTTQYIISRWFSLFFM